jgi:hypothetical protein
MLAMFKKKEPKAARAVQPPLATSTAEGK